MSTSAQPRVLVFGIAFYFPLGGVPYQALHYVEGLRRLGYDVYYVEDTYRWGSYDPDLNQYVGDVSASITRVAELFERFGLAGRWGYRGRAPGGITCGLTDRQIDDLYATADAFLNLTGSQELREEHLGIPRRILIETDPVMPQIEVAQGNARTIRFMADHTIIFSFGLNLHRPDCLVPTERFTWHPTVQPVLVDHWESDLPTSGRPYTTVGTWENKGKDLVYQGETYTWSKHHQWLKFVDLPRRVAHVAELEMASDVAEPTATMLRNHGWRLASALHTSRDFDRYRQYIQMSRGEFTVAKDQNIRLRSGWFSDRAVCYLAAGRPVITQETGFTGLLPTGQGLFGFQTAEDVVQALETIERDYPAASRAARAIAYEYFAAEKVLASVMQRAGVG